MHFRFDTVHEDLRASVRGLLGAVASDEVVRRDLERGPGWDPSTWRRLCDELDLPSMAVPETFGGSGFGLVELGIALTEAGRSLLCAPLLSTCMAAQALLRTAPGDALRDLARGARTGTLAFREPGRTWDAQPRTGAEAGGDGWRLTGTKDWVLDGCTADLLIVSARTARGTSLFLVEPGRDGVTAEAVETVDPTRRVARVRLDAAPADLLGTDGAAPIRDILHVATVMLAAEQVGVAERCLDMAVEYARARCQFGRPIGSFQAIKHKLADVLLEVEAARAAALYAALATDQALDDAAEATNVAGYTCAEAALHAAGENIQVHGGIGMTWEHPAQLFLRRASLDRVLVHSPQAHLEHLMDLVDRTEAR